MGINPARCLHPCHFDHEMKTRKYCLSTAFWRGVKKQRATLKVIVFLLQMRAQQLIFRVFRAGWLASGRLLFRLALALRNFFLNAIKINAVFGCQC